MSKNITRSIQSNIENKLFQGKTIIIYGPRRVGKTTITRSLLGHFPEGKYLNCDEPDIRQRLTNKTTSDLISLIGSHRVVVIDEAQRIKNIGITLKQITDNIPATQVIATGSSSFDLANEIKEPLTGRAYEFYLYPLTLTELGHPTSTSIESLMILGSYPEIITKPDPQTIIRDIAQNYLYKDALTFQNLKKSDNLEKLLQAIALQLGSEVSYDELGTIAGIDKNTVERYLSILEQAFIIFRIKPYSHNQRKTITKKHKIYFWDNGIRNSIVNNYNPLSLRNDVGALWENFAISQTLITDYNLSFRHNYYFWRTYDGQEIDLVKEISGKLQPYEFKYSPAKSPRIPSQWKLQNPSSNPLIVINPENIIDHLTSIL